jgi:hypothetical protein
MFAVHDQGAAPSYAPGASRNSTQTWLKGVLAEFNGAPAPDNQVSTLPVDYFAMEKNHPLLGGL